MNHRHSITSRSFRNCRSRDILPRIARHMGGSFLNNSFSVDRPTKTASLRELIYRFRYPNNALRMSDCQQTHQCGIVLFRPEKSFLFARSPHSARTRRATAAEFNRLIGEPVLCELATTSCRTHKISQYSIRIAGIVVWRVVAVQDKLFTLSTNFEFVSDIPFSNSSFSAFRSIGKFSN